MPPPHRPIPSLPNCPRARAICKEIHRSFPTGRKETSRTIVGRELELTITTRDRFPKDIRANLMTTINSPGEGVWIKVPFEVIDDQTMVCRIVPSRTGLFSFWTQFSTDGGNTWMHDPVPDGWVLVDPPQVDALRMYTLIPSVSGTITDWRRELVRIKDLGFNAVHFLPLTTLDTSRSPYSAKKLFEVDENYVDPEGDPPDGIAQLEMLIETAKSLGIRLCFDLVLNHVGVDSEIANRAPEWIVPDEESRDGLRRARYLSEHGWQAWHDLVLINYEHPSQRIRAGIWEYLQEYALFWGQFASETGGFVRFDNLHSSDKAFIDSLTQQLHSSYPNLAVVAEYFTDAASLLDTVPKWGLSLVLATPWDSRFVGQLRDYLEYIHSIADHVRFFMPVTSHDSGTPAQEFASPLATIPRYVAAALLGNGATGITQGVEWGQPEKINFIGRQARVTAPERPMFADLLRKVNAILAEEPAFRRGDNFRFVDNGNHAVIAVYRKDPRPGQVGFLVVCNFDILGPQEIEIDLSAILGSHDAACVDLIGGGQHICSKGRVKLTLDACSALVLKL